MALRDNLLALSKSQVLTCENKDNNMVWIKMRQFQERAWDCGHSMSPHKANSWITVFLDKRKKSEGNMPLLFVTSSSEDGRGGLCPRALVAMQASGGGSHQLGKICSLWLSQTTKPEKPLPVCSSPQPVQANLCSSQNKTAIPARHSFAENLAQAGAMKSAVPVRLEQTRLS